MDVGSTPTISTIQTPSDDVGGGFSTTPCYNIILQLKSMLKNFGLNVDDEARATALVGELGNNVFDHNDGQWPTDVRGAIILA